MNNGNIYESYSGVLFAFILFIGTLRVFYLRNNKEYSFIKVYNWNPVDIFIWLNESYKYYFDNIRIISGIYIIFNILLLSFIIPALVSDSYLPSTDNILHLISLVLGIGITYNIIIAPSMYLLYDSYKIKKE
jgi:hypothetical protein